MCFVWPVIQEGMRSMQGFSLNQKLRCLYLSVLAKILIPTGLHHFVYAPFAYDSAVVEGEWPFITSHIGEFQTTAFSLKELYPFGGFSPSGMSKVFGTAGLSLAMIQAARPDKRKSDRIDCTGSIDGYLTGITEPIEFTFLFVAPALWFVHAYWMLRSPQSPMLSGLSGTFGGGLINWLGSKLAALVEISQFNLYYPNHYRADFYRYLVFCVPL